MSGRNIFVFFDGTSASISTNTNITRMRELVSRRPAEFPYREGPGKTFSWKTLRSLNRLLGFDLDDTAKSVYRELLTLNVTPFDRLFIFGYSRGAVTARILVQMITISSVRDKFFAKGDLEEVLSANIHFVGLFDPVLGWPHVFKRSNREKQIAKNRKVKCYVELIAIDERFALFPIHTGMHSMGSTMSRYSKTGAAALTPELSAQDEIERKSMSQRIFIWMPGEHADIGNQGGDPVIGDHALLTMAEQLLAYSEDLNNTVYVDPHRLSDYLNSIEMDDEIRIGAGRLLSRTVRHVFGWRRRNPRKGDGSVVHELAKNLEGRSGVLVKYFRRSKRAYCLSKHFESISTEPCGYERVRRECASRGTESAELT